MGVVDKNEEVYFIYSDEEYDARNKTLERLNLKFYCGTVSIDTDVVQYTNIIRKEDLKKTRELYPDLKVVHVGTLTNSTYTKTEER